MYKPEFNVQSRNISRTPKVVMVMAETHCIMP